MRSISNGHHMIWIAAILIAFIFVPKGPYAWAGWEHFDPNNMSILPSSQINSLAKDPNKLWIGTDAGLVSVMLGDVNNWEDYPEVDANYIPITSMAMEEGDILWLGTPKGLVSYDLEMLSLDEYPGLEFNDADQIVEIVVNPNYVWVATDKGVNRFDLYSEEWTLYRNDPNGFDPNTAIGIASSEDDVIWVLPGAPFPFGAYRYIVSSDQWDWFPEDIFTSLVMGDSNDVWFGTPGSGLFRFQPDPNIWDQWQAAQYELPSNAIQAIGMEQGANRIIVATTGGLARYDLNLLSGLWQPIGPPASIDIDSQTITEILVDANHHQVWFGTENGGLYRWVEGAIIWSSPVNGIEDVPLDINTIDVVFSERIDPNTIQLGGAGSSITLTMLDPNDKQMDPNIADPNHFTCYFYDPITNTHLVIEPLNDLYPNTLYEFKFTTDITNYVGTQIKNVDNELSFRTVIPPGVVDTVPDPNAIDVIPHEPVEIVFNKSMDPNSFFPNMLTFNTGGLPTSINESETSFPDPNRLVINVSGGLDVNKKYTFSVSKNVTDIAGNELLDDFEFSFTTKSAPQIQFQAGYSPDPGDADINVSLDTNIAVSFNRAMDTASVEAHFTIDPNITGSFSWLNGDTRVVFQPDVQLSSGTLYTVAIDANAKDTDGIRIGTTQSWSFTTALDLIPSIISVFPAEDEASASIYTKVKVTFDKAMDTNSVENAFTLKDASLNDILGSFQWSGDLKEFQFDPNGLLDPNMTYTASVSSAAESDGGFALDPNKTWQFTAVLPQTFSEPVGGWPKLDIMGMNPNTTAISALAFDPNDGSLWAGIALIDSNSNWTGQGVYHYNGAAWTSYGTGLLSSNAVTDIVIDRQGNVWVATEPDPNGGGVHMFDGQSWHHYSPAIDPNQFFIENRGILTPIEIQDFFQVNAIGIYKTGTEDLIWIATTGGIAVGRYDSGFGDWKWSATADHRLLYMLAIDHVTDTIWFGDPFWNPNSPCAAIAGLDADDFIQRFGQWPDVWDPNDMVWKPNGGLSKMRFLGQPPPNLRAMTADGSHNLWLATKDGLYKISMDSLILGSCDYEIYGIVETGGGLLSNNILDVVINPDDPNVLWVNTDAGISVYDLTKPVESPASWIRYPLTGIQVLVILPIPNGGVWTGTNKGLKITGDTVSPTVTDSYPTDQATDIPIGEDYYVSFSELMDPNVTEAAFSFVDALSTPVPGVLSWEGKTLNFTPSSALSPSTQYSMRVDTTAKDLAGNALSQAFQVDFTTTGSWVSSTSPNQNAIDVSTSVMITINFIKPMDPNTTTDAFCLRKDPNVYGSNPCVDGNLVWPENKVINFYPSMPLDEGVVYVLTINTNATDPNGIHMPAPFTLKFTTVPVSILDWVSDSYPRDGEQGINPDVVITIYFEIAMDPNTTERAFCLKKDPNQYGSSQQCVDGSFVWPENKVINFYPSEPLDTGTIYILTIDTNATNSNGIHMPEAFTMSFRTAFAQRVLKFTGVGCFIRSVEEDGIGILDRIKVWLNMVRKTHVGFEP